MKILHINTNSTVGGAAVAANRLHQGLLKNRVDSQFLFKYGNIDNQTFIKYPLSYGLINKVENKYKKYLLNKYPNRTETRFSIENHFGNVSDYINAMDIDIVHLHWVNNFLRVEDISNINKPIVWSLHDMNPFTGGCHYDEECEGYMSNCGTCRVLSENKACNRSYNALLKKETLWLKQDITVNGLSKWLAECAKSSRLFSNRTIVNIPNPIDLECFNVIDKVTARDRLSLPLNKKIILFGAWGVNSDPRKGFSYFKKAISKMNLKKDELVILLLGNPPIDEANNEFDIISLGFVSSNKKLNLIYSAVDVFISPSKQENLSNMILESLACGTPVVAFNIGGNSDMIVHKNNGFLANAFDEKSLAEGLDWTLEDEIRIRHLSINSRQSVANKFDLNTVITKYIELYMKIKNK